MKEENKTIAAPAAEAAPGEQAGLTEEQQPAAVQPAAEAAEAPQEPRKGGSQLSAKVLYMVRLAVLIALIVVMSMTPIGYLKIGTIEVSFLTLPVIIGAILLGPGGGALLGAAFGISSFVQCFGMSAFGAALLAINPFYTFVVCFFPRLLMGWLTGVVFKTLRFLRMRFAAYSITSFLGAFFNTGFFMVALLGLFGNTDYMINLQQSLGATSLASFVFALVGINGLLEMAVCLIFGMVISRILSAVERGSLKRAQKRSEKEAQKLGAENQQLKTDKDSLSEATHLLNDNLKAVQQDKQALEDENKSLKARLMAQLDKDNNGRLDILDSLDKDDNGKIDLFERKPKADEPEAGKKD
ncbi:MAG: ECF transporter S component [Oscillospiraceae bacterium]|nr:ECF transporter S component [Oscillospiraceae bacterium]